MNNLVTGNTWIKNINMEAMKVRPGLLKFLEKARDLNVEFITGQNGDLSVKYNGRYLYSLINPREAAKKEIENSNWKEKGVILVIGLGLGYIIEELLPYIKPNQKIIIVDRDYALLKAALPFKRFDKIIKHPNVEMAIAGEEGKNASAVVQPFINKIEFEGLEVLRDRASYMLDRDDYKAFEKNLIDYLRTANVGELTNMVQMYRFTNNEILNTPYYLVSPGVDVLKGILKDTPAIVVSGGPSLNKNIDLLKEVKGKALIIALGTTLKPLLYRGIKPDIVIAIDPAPAQIKYFDDIDIPDDILLVTTNVFNTRALLYWKGKTAWVNEGTSYVRFLDRITHYYRDTIYLGMTVAHSATSLAYYMGANPIVLVGQDLSYSSKKSHVDGAALAHEVDLSKMDVIWVEGNYEDKVPTLRNFLAYIKLFEGFISSTKSKDPNIKFMNATEGGAKIKGTEIMTLREVIDTYLPSEEKDFTSLIDDAYYSKEINFSLDEAKEQFHGKVLELEKIKEKLENLLKMVKKIDPDAKKLDLSFIERFNKRVREVHREIEKFEAFEFMERFVKAFNVMKERREYKSIQKSDIRERLRTQKEKSENFYTTLYTVTLYFQQLLSYTKNKRLKIAERIFKQKGKLLGTTTDN